MFTILIVKADFVVMTEVEMDEICKQDSTHQQPERCAFNWGCQNIGMFTISIWTGWLIKKREYLSG